MKRIGTITFHSSYNYGSCLQAYALQKYITNEIVKKCEYKIINLRIPKQRELYSNYWKKSGLKNFIKRIIYFNKKNEIQKKDELYEDFINNKLHITKEYNSLEELQESDENFDYYISGSDQLWNLNAYDFDWSYYLEFVKSGKKISYSASFGDRKQEWTIAEKNRVTKDIKQYDCISVREEESCDVIKKITKSTPPIHIDPTMLLKYDDWMKLISNDRIIKEKYIFFYNLKQNKEIVKLAKKIGKKLNLPIIISKCPNKYEIFGFKKKFDIGPLEFLNLIKNSELTLSSSFHGTVFSILLKKPFFALGASNDYRIITLLEKMNLKDRSINNQNFDELIKNSFNIDYRNVEKVLNDEREKSKNYLKKSLDV